MYLMKFFRLSTGIRQLIIFALLIALLWESRPVVGPDGRLFVKFTDFPGSNSPRFLDAEDNINIEETSPHPLQDGIYNTWYLLKNVPLASATWKEPLACYQFIEKYLPVSTYLPQSLRFGGGWILVLKLTPEEYDILQAARRSGNPLDIIKIKKGEGYTSFRHEKRSSGTK